MTTVIFNRSGEQRTITLPDASAFAPNKGGFNQFTVPIEDVTKTGAVLKLSRFYKDTSVFSLLPGSNSNITLSGSTLSLTAPIDNGTKQIALVRETLTVAGHLLTRDSTIIFDNSAAEYGVPSNAIMNSQGGYVMNNSGGYVLSA